MTTPAQRAKLAHQLDAARQRSERAADLGDHAGSLIAAGDARLILRRMLAASQGDYNERTRRPIIAAHMARMLGR